MSTQRITEFDTSCASVDVPSDSEHSVCLLDESTAVDTGLDVNEEYMSKKYVYCCLLAAIASSASIICIILVSLYLFPLALSYPTVHLEWTSGSQPQSVESQSNAAGSVFHTHSTITNEPAPVKHRMRIYQYPLSLFNDSGLFHRCSQAHYAANAHGWREMYAVEYWFANKIQQHIDDRNVKFIIPLSYQQDYFNSSEQLEVEFTDDPTNADFYVVPHTVTCVTHAYLHEMKTYFEAAAGAATDKYFVPILDHIQYKLPYWNATRNGKPGSNHIFVFSWDMGVCIVKPILDRLKNAIKLQGHGHDASNPAAYKVLDRELPCFDNNTIVVPQVSWQIPTSLLLDPLQMNYILTSKKIPVERFVSARSTLMYMRGSIYAPGDVNQAYSHGVRQKLAELSANMTKANPGQMTLFVVANSSINYLAELKQSMLGICARGWAPWTGRLQAIMNTETIPLIIADEIVMPFENLIDWRMFSVKLNESNMDEATINRVKALSTAYLEEKQKQLWIHSQYFSWHGDTRYNAFAMTMRELYMIKQHGSLSSSIPKTAFTEYL
jgi:hypothetical protein